MVHLFLLARRSRTPLPRWAVVFKGVVLLALLVFQIGVVVVTSHADHQWLERSLSRRGCQWNPWCSTLIWDIEHGKFK